MSWINRKKSAKEIARRVGEKVARWEQEAQEARNRILASGTSLDLGWTGTIEEQTDSPPGARHGARDGRPQTKPGGAEQGRAGPLPI